MLSNLCRIVLYGTLTVLFNFFMFNLRTSSLASDRDLSLFISCGLIFLLLPTACWQLKKIKPYKKRAWMSENPIVFSPDKIDCYVRFIGRIMTEQAQHLPLSGSECAFYIASVVAEWETKQKKPGSGMETQRKPLLREQSSEELLLESKEGLISITAADFSANWLELRKWEKTQVNCPPQATDKAKSKYTTYRLLERYLQHGDKVAAQGRLTLHPDGRLFIKPTGRLDFPSFVTLETQYASLTETIATTARHEMWIKRINTTFLLINALLLIKHWR